MSEKEGLSPFGRLGQGPELSLFLSHLRPESNGLTFPNERGHDRGFGHRLNIDIDLYVILVTESLQPGFRVVVQMPESRSIKLAQASTP